jgi:hypothetical protein
MNEEEKAINDCMNDDLNVFEGAYDELEDDFVLMLNEGKPALEQIKAMGPPPILNSQHENAGVEVLKEEDDGVMNSNMIPNYKE